MPKILQMSKDIHLAIQTLRRSDPELYSDLQNIITKYAHPADADFAKVNNSIFSVSYSLGVVLAANLKNQGFTSINSEEFANGFSDSLKGSTSLTVEEADAKISEVMTKIQEEKAAEAKSEGESFLAENAKNDGIVVTESGLQYSHSTIGEGDYPTAEDTVTVHYKGTLIDGTEFDSSYKRGEPVSFPLNGVISGWTEGLQLMKIGGKTTFYIPQQLAYGAKPNSNGPIPPYAALIFEVELIDIKKA